MRVLIATTNEGKLKEFQRLLGDKVEVASLSDLGLGSPQEDGDTFEANAELKARAAAGASGLLTIADDSGLQVDALNGEPGVYSARFAGVDATDAANRALLLERLQDYGPVDRTARFVSVLSVCTHTGTCESFRGQWEGRVASAARGDGGFGYDSLFELPDGRTAAEILPSEKNAISHRAVAFKNALPYLQSLIDQE